MPDKIASHSHCRNSVRSFRRPSTWPNNENTSSLEVLIDRYVKHCVRLCSENTTCRLRIGSFVRYILIFLQFIKHTRLSKGDPFSSSTFTYSVALFHKNVSRIVRTCSYCSMKSYACFRNNSLSYKVNMANFVLTSYHRNFVPILLKNTEKVVSVLQMYSLLAFTSSQSNNPQSMPI